MAKITHDLVLAVKEMLERHWSIAEMAAKLNVDSEDIRIVLEILNQVIT